MRTRTKFHEAAGCLSDIGVKLKNEGMIDEAVTISEIAMQLDPDDGRNRVNLGHAYVDQGQIEKAISEYEKALELDPNLEYAYDGLGGAYVRKGLLDKAIGYFRKAVELDPKSAVARKNLAGIYMDNELYDEAIREWKAASELEPNNMAILNELGICYKNEGLLDKAIATFRLAILHDPTDPIYHDNLGRVHNLKGFLKEATKEYRLAIRFGGETASIHNFLGNIYAESNLFSKALKEFTKATKLDPNMQLFKDNFITVQAIIASQESGKLDDVRKKRKELKIADDRSQEAPIIKGQENKAENTIEKWFEELRGEVIGELAFVDKTTFGYLDSIPKSCGLRIIVSNIKEEDVCREKARKYSRNRPYFEIIKIPKIHKRWIGSQQNFFIDIGADLKMDALGHSTHTIRKIQPQDYREESEQFEKLWKVSDEELKHKYGSNNVSKTMFFSTSQTNGEDAKK